MILRKGCVAPSIPGNQPKKGWSRTSCLAPLQVLEIEIGEFTAAQPTSEKDGENRPISLAFERSTIRRLP